jgi:hypothetical protein
MIQPALKKLALIVISTIGLYFSGLHLITMSGVGSLTDALNVMTFFLYYFYQQTYLVKCLKLSLSSLNWKCSVLNL